MDDTHPSACAVDMATSRVVDYGAVIFMFGVWMPSEIVRWVRECLSEWVGACGMS